MIVYICTNCEEPLVPSEFKDGKCPACGCNKIIPEDEYFAIDSSQPTTQNIPKCPTCGSTKVHPISAGKKAIGFAMVGIFSKNFGKSYECDDCKYRW